MNQRNYSVSAEEKQELIKISREVRKEIINAMRKAEIFQRKRKLTRYTILFEALYKYLADGLSFYRLASYMDCRYNVKLSVTAWKKQLYRAIPILRRIVKEYMAKHVMSACQAQGQRKAYALDATAFSSEGHSGTSTRVHSQVALMDGLCRYDKITDEHGAESVKNFPHRSGSAVSGGPGICQSPADCMDDRSSGRFVVPFFPEACRAVQGSSLYQEAGCRSAA